MTEKAQNVFGLLLPEEVKRKAHEVWTLELLEHAWDSLQGFHSHEEIEKMEIVTAFPLTEEQLETIDREIQKKIGKKIKIDEKIDESLIAGLKITVGHLVLESCLAAKLNESLRHA